VVLYAAIEDVQGDAISLGSPVQSWTQMAIRGKEVPQAPGEMEVASIAREAVCQAMHKTEYEALKVLAWRFRYGTHVLASSAADGIRHAVYISSEEVVHREDCGQVASERWVTFLLRFPNWRAVAWPEDTAHADEVATRARAKVGTLHTSNGLFHSSEQFVQECFSGVARNDEAISKLSVVASMATGGAVVGAVASVPYTIPASSYATFAAAGAATAVGGSAVAVVGVAAGAAAGALLAAPTYLAWKQRAQHAALGRVHFCVVNETERPLVLRTYRAPSAIPFYGSSSTSEGVLLPGHILELDPADDAEEFRLTFSEKGYLFSSEVLCTVAQRGGVYCLKEEDAQVCKESEFGGEAALSLNRIPRAVLPAFRPEMP